MPILAIALLLTSAALHALWNLILKQSPEKYIAMGWQVIISGVLSFFILFFTGLPPRSMWLYALISMTLEAIYFVLLSFAYSDHDFSLVYPVARGAAPALVVLWSLLFLHEIPSFGGFIGVITIIFGMVIIGSAGFFQPDGHKPQVKGIAIALSIAVVISVYTLLDGYAVKHGPALSYGLTMFALVPVLQQRPVRHVPVHKSCGNLRRWLWIVSRGLWYRVFHQPLLPLILRPDDQYLSPDRNARGAYQLLAVGDRAGLDLLRMEVLDNRLQRLRRGGGQRLI